MITIEKPDERNSDLTNVELADLIEDGLERRFIIAKEYEVVGDDEPNYRSMLELAVTRLRDQSTTDPSHVRNLVRRETNGSARTRVVRSIEGL
ncbi:TPA: hypothetical protein DD449_01280 [Candidatus Berkelbacteria bacterium]|uniref:Uncharacterized protein n=1 Tax=Berkelbacteria bacterium GW2011_GWE1_39_12 TaxID=1618337 RepID=A0A0G4B418_9BACT|nr:MAG: hypothetical protein UT28_C0001G0831 [Berkelbacteria bacterium GW2011_GWE1_39_12]HBO60303.1 hypothetical protein [Candidatus Berkelbacteria bacterium]